MHQMANCASFQLRMASIMEVLTKTAVAEMTKLVEDGSAALRLEMCRSQRENEALKTKLLLMEGELRALRGYGEGTTGNSLNLSFQVQVCDESREALRPEVAGKGRAVAVERVFHGELSTDSTKDDKNIPVEKKKDEPSDLDIKYEPVDGEQVWSESLLLSEDRLEEDPKSSQSQVEQKIIEEDTCGTSRAAAASAGEGPLCKEEELHMQPCPAGDPEKGLQAELKQEPEEQPLTPTLPLLESVDLGLGIQSVWSEANSSGIVWEKRRPHGVITGHGYAQFNDDFSPRHYTVSQGLHLEKDEGSASHLEQKQNGRPLDKECSHGQPDDVLAEMEFPQGSPGECDGSTPCEARPDTSAEAEIPCRTEGQEEELICTQCGKTFPDALELKTHEEQHSAGKRFSCSECGKGFTSSRILEKHQQVHSRKKLYVCMECGKHFSCKNLLEAHQRFHTREKPFTCELCGKCFSRKGNLKTHQSVHTGEKPHRCHKCGRSFAQLGNLKTHQRVHIGGKPFSCTLCSRSFSQNRALQRHVRSHNQDSRLTSSQHPG